MCSEAVVKVSSLNYEKYMLYLTKHTKFWKLKFSIKLKNAQKWNFLNFNEV